MTMNNLVFKPKTREMNQKNFESIFEINHEIAKKL